MEFNAALWDERHKETNCRLDKTDADLRALRIALFGNGEKETSIASNVAENTKFRKEWERRMNRIVDDVMKRLVWTGLILTSVMLLGFGAIIYLITTIANAATP